jgi:hypothetical protein
LALPYIGRGKRQSVFAKVGAILGAALVIGWPQPVAASGVAALSSSTVNGSPVTLTVASPGQVAIATFTGVLGQRTTVVVNSVSKSNSGCETLAVIYPNGNVVGTASGCGSAISVGPVNLTIAGTYQVRFALDPSATGSGSLWVSAPISLGTATVNSGSAAMTVTRVGQGVIRTFTGALGQRVTVVVSGVTTSNTGCERLAPIDPNSNTVGTGSSCGSAVSVASANLTVAGTYQVLLEVDPTATSSGGTLWVSAPISVGTATVNGASTAMTVTRIGQGVVRTFTGGLSQRITVVVTGVSTSNTGCENLTLIDPNSNTAATGNSCGGAVSVGPFNLSTAGTYQVRFAVDPSATGSGTLWVSAPVGGGTATVNTGSPPMTVTRFGQGVISAFTGVSGQSITAVVTNVSSTNNGCETLALLDPSGNALSTGGGCGSGSAVSVGPINLKVTGTYHLRFAVDNSATGSGTLWVSAPVSLGSSTVNGASTAMTVARFGQGVIRTFSGLSGQRIAVVVNSVSTTNNGCANLALVDPNGNTVKTSSTCNSSAVSVGQVTLPFAGVYQVLLATDPSATGGGTLWVSAPVSAGTATVNLGFPALNVVRVGQGVFRTFSGTLGERITVVVNSVSTSNSGCATLALVDPNGNTVNTNSTCNSSAVSVGPVTLPFAGTYQVRLEVDPVATGGGTLWVSAPIIAGTATVNGAATQLNVIRLGEGVIRTFSGTLGERITVALNNASTSDSGCETLTLIDPTGSTVGSGNNCNSNAVGVNPVTLASSGTYEVRLEVDPAATGGGTLWISAPISAGSVTVNAAATPMNVIRLGQGVFRSFSGVSGQRITVPLNNVSSSDNGCETLALIDPSGSTVTTGSNCGNQVAISPVTLSTTGTYQVRLEFDPTATGSGTLWLSAPISVGPATVNLGSELIDVDRLGQEVIRTFNATSGERITLAVNNVTTGNGGCKSLALIDPSGSTVGSGSNCGDANPVSVGPITVSLTGTYQVRFEVDPSVTGDGTLWISAPISAGAATVNGASTPMNVTRIGQGVIRNFNGTTGQRVALVVNNVRRCNSGCESLAMIDPTGSTINTGSSCSSAVAAGPQTLTVSGTYQVRFELDPSATGSGTLWVSAPIIVGTVTVNGPSAAMNVTRVGQGVIRTFSAASGQIITAAIYNVNTTDHNCENLALIDASGTTLASGANCGDFTSVILNSVTLVSSGTYQVRFEVDQAATGGGSLRVSA